MLFITKLYNIETWIKDKNYNASVTKNEIV